MPNSVIISKKILKFDKIISANPDKSLSIRWVLMAAQAIGKSIAYNLLNSDDVNNALIAVKKLGVKVIKKKNLCQINGVGLNGFSLKNNTIINANLIELGDVSIVPNSISGFSNLHFNSIKDPHQCSCIHSIPTTNI